MDVVLDADCSNAAALRLYQNRGFVTEFVDPIAEYASTLQTKPLHTLLTKGIAEGAEPLCAEYASTLQTKPLHALLTKRIAERAEPLCASGLPRV